MSSVHAEKPTPGEMILEGEVLPARFDLSPESEEALPLAQWLERRASLEGVGVIVEGADSIDALQTLLRELPFVALHLARYTDGRIYSHARRLRELWGYQGVILVFGDVLRDQIFYMSRCGINAFYMREDQDLHASLAAFSLYSENYQYN